MDSIVQSVITIFCAVLASSGLWAFLQKRIDAHEKDNPQRRLLVGLAHDRIIELGMRYIDRGWITQDEYENLYKYLYQPYKDAGGNGSATRVMAEVDKLHFKNV